MLLLGVNLGSGPLYVAGQRYPRGVLATPTGLGPLLPGFAGDAFLDYPNYGMTDWTTLVSSQGTSGVTQFDLTATLGLSPATTWTQSTVWQMACIDQFGTIVGCDAQPFSVGQ
ncbi:MAG: hypothetical protein HRU14_14270 [Planctomycetes bacterium]|nr:hypothetical protein [Planctomycetota bacterium]